MVIFPQEIQLRKSHLQKSPHKVKGQYDQAVGLISWFGFRIGMPVVFNRFGSGYTDFKRASMDTWTIGFQKDKKKLTDIGLFVLVFL